MRQLNYSQRSCCYHFDQFLHRFFSAHRLFPTAVVVPIKKTVNTNLNNVFIGRLMSSTSGSHISHVFARKKFFFQNMLIAKGHPTSPTWSAPLIINDQNHDLCISLYAKFLTVFYFLLSQQSFNPVEGRFLIVISFIIIINCDYITSKILQAFYGLNMF